MKPRFDPTRPTSRASGPPLVRAAGSVRLTKKELLALGKKKPAPPAK